MQKTARGTFEVEMQPESEEKHNGGTVLGRFSLSKRYAGDLTATAAGELLSARTATEGSAGYVALEHVDGTLDGRRGAFVLQHLGAMSAAGQQLEILVVPDSGTGELEGLEGRLGIEIEDGEHRYELVYSLPED